MSGYLQRLVARATGHGSAKHPTVHPILGSVFSPASQIAGEVEGFSGNRVEHDAGRARGMESVHSIRSSAEQDEQPSPEPRPAFFQAQPFSAPPFPSRPALPQTRPSFDPFSNQQRRDSSSEPVEPARGPENPALEPKPRELASQSMGNAGAGHISEAKPSEREELPQIMVSETGSTREQAQSGQYKPLFDTEIPVVPPVDVERRQDRGAPRARLNTRQYSNRRSPQPVARQEGHDEIEIHIGRIEVTAVPPLVVRAESSRPPRPSPSLGEYLKRRNGRA